MTLRRLIGEAKAVPFSFYLLDLIKEGLKAPLVFAWHKSTLDIVQELLTSHGVKVGRIDGTTAENKRQPIVDAFQAGQIDALVCNIQAGGEGLTMTRAKRLFMLESGFTPKDNSQPIKRIHRIGQDCQTYAEFITLSGSYDENIVDIVRGKVQAIFDIDQQEILAAPAQ
jgi:SNF2 family DNA or RNA helicase